MSEHSGDPAPTARVLLAAAGLPVDQTEAAAFEATFAALRAQADSLYLPFLEPVTPAFGFDAAFPESGEDLR